MLARTSPRGFNMVFRPHTLHKDHMSHALQQRAGRPRAGQIGKHLAWCGRRRSNTGTNTLSESIRKHPNVTPNISSHLRVPESLKYARPGPPAPRLPVHASARMDADPAAAALADLLQAIGDIQSTQYASVAALALWAYDTRAFHLPPPRFLQLTCRRSVEFRG